MSEDDSDWDKALSVFNTDVARWGRWQERPRHTNLWVHTYVCRVSESVAGEGYLAYVSELNHDLIMK